MIRRWRPSLAMVLGGALAATLLLSFLGLVALRYLGPEIGFRQAAVVLAIVITAATAGLGAVMVRLLLRPIRALERYAHAQEAGIDASPPAHFGTAELYATARGVMRMAEALRDREATVRAYTDHVTHELKTPVSAIRAAVELLEDGGDLGREDAALLARVDGARAQIEGQLAALRRVAQARETRYVGESLLVDFQDALCASFPDVQVEIEGGDTPLPMAQAGIEVVLTQLLRNAAEHGARHVSIIAEGREIRLRDDGAGVSAGNQSRVFDPFFTTKRDHGGTGMGLAVVRAVLRAHRADIALQPSEAGACFVIRFKG